MLIDKDTRQISMEFVSIEEFYLDHRTVDSRHSIITDTFEPPAMYMTASLTLTVWTVSADSKQLHRHRYARLRGRGKVIEQCLAQQYKT